MDVENILFPLFIKLKRQLFLPEDSYVNIGVLFSDNFNPYKQVDIFFSNNLLTQIKMSHIFLNCKNFNFFGARLQFYIFQKNFIINLIVINLIVIKNDFFRNFLKKLKMSNREIRKKRRILEESFEKVLYQMLSTTRNEFQNILVGDRKIKYLESLDSLFAGKENMEMKDFMEKVKNVEIDTEVFKKLYDDDMEKWREDIEMQDTEFLTMLLHFISQVE